MKVLVFIAVGALLKVVAENAMSGDALMQFRGPNDQSNTGKPLLGRMLPHRARAHAMR
jgi:hypothetical protein